VFSVECEDACDDRYGATCSGEYAVAFGAVNGHGSDEGCGECCPWQEQPSDDAERSTDDDDPSGLCSIHFVALLMCRRAYRLAGERVVWAGFCGELMLETSALAVAADPSHLVVCCNHVCRRDLHEFEVATFGLNGVVAVGLVEFALER